MNGTTTVTITQAGQINADGSCKAGTYIEAERTWTKVIATVSDKIHARDYFAKVRLENKETSLMNGITCPYLERYCLDSMYGETVWNWLVHIS